MPWTLRRLSASSTLNPEDAEASWRSSACSFWTVLGPLIFELPRARILDLGSGVEACGLGERGSQKICAVEALYEQQLAQYVAEIKQPPSRATL